MHFAQYQPVRTLLIICMSFYEVLSTFNLLVVCSRISKSTSEMSDCPTGCGSTCSGACLIAMPIHISCYSKRSCRSANTHEPKCELACRTCVESCLTDHGNITAPALAMQCLPCNNLSARRNFTPAHQNMQIWRENPGPGKDRSVIGCQRFGRATFAKVLQE